jgi:hypothetical protein
MRGAGMRYFFVTAPTVIARADRAHVLLTSRGKYTALIHTPA